MTDNEKLAQLAKTESWQIFKKLLEQTASKYFGWETAKDLSEAKGVHQFKNQIIRKVEGAKEALETTAEEKSAESG